LFAPAERSVICPTYLAISTLRTAGTQTVVGRAGYKHLAPLEPEHRLVRNST